MEGVPFLLPGWASPRLRRGRPGSSSGGSPWPVDGHDVRDLGASSALCRPRSGRVRIAGAPWALAHRLCMPRVVALGGRGHRRVAAGYVASPCGEPRPGRRGRRATGRCPAPWSPPSVLSLWWATARVSSRAHASAWFFARDRACASRARLDGRRRNRRARRRLSMWRRKPLCGQRLSSFRHPHRAEAAPHRGDDRRPRQPCASRQRGSRPYAYARGCSKPREHCAVH